MKKMPKQVKVESPGRVRIIAGRWRGSRLPISDSPGLRPTSDRVRETLFNWLQQQIPGACVLDAFAGTGALGLEAASRGAAFVHLVEASPPLAHNLRALVSKFDAHTHVHVHQADVLAFLRQFHDAPFDIAFVDPPFAAGLWDEVLALLVDKMRPDAWIYVESPLNERVALPADWGLHRESQTRDVRYALYRRVTLHPSS